MKELALPAIVDDTSALLERLTESLGVPREVLATDKDIKQAWTSLPDILENIPIGMRNELLARMCISVATGLFDSAINYAWNIAIIALREKIHHFGVHVVSQIISKDFDEQDLFNLTDSDLLSLCLKLNLLNEDGFFFLDQCRDIRNNFSAAHPSVGDLDAHELLNFVNRCSKYAFEVSRNPKGVDVNAFIKSLKSGKYSKEQIDMWVSRIVETHQAQRELLFEMIHGIYCDSESSEETRINCLIIAQKFIESLSPKTKSKLVDRHSDYVAKGDEARRKASMVFFEKLNLLHVLSDHEKHTIITSVCEKLYSVHLEFNNFYNEPPFAERLLEISSQSGVPDSAKEIFVETVVTCAVGNAYGTSNVAYMYYEKMIKNFSPAEVVIMLNLRDSKNRVGVRIRGYKRCNEKFKSLVMLINEATVPTKSMALFNKILERE